MVKQQIIRGASIKYVWDTDKLITPEALRAHLAERKVGAMLICPVVEFPKGSVIQAKSNFS